MKRFLAYLRLMRPANIVTAVADICLGFAASGAAAQLSVQDFTIDTIAPLIWLSLSTIGLYGGGVVMNDVFDAELDKVERPERPIPSGLATKSGATILGFGLLLFGIAMAWQVSLLSMLIAVAVAVLAVTYDAWGKHQKYLGPINMGMCRGGNLLLGVSAIAPMVAVHWYLAIIPIVYIAAITMISRGEVHGGSKQALYGAVVMYIAVIGAMVALTLLPNYHVMRALPFLALFAALIFPPLFRAIKDPQGKNIGKAVKGGIIALIVFDATMAAGFAGWKYALIVVALLPVSILLAKKFAVT